jgi:hypothetical protein
MALEKQMDLFQEGGMIDEGGTTDPVSGNDVPTGSLKKEVRDDIPAQLSEGEFVMPADVVRFHGLDKMMELRDEAKMGLQRMEDMGQMGNSEEATIPDGIPFNMDDLELEDEPMEMQVGGFVQPSFTPGGMQQSQFAQYQPQFTPYQMPQYTAPSYTGYQAPQQAYTPMAPAQTPTFTEFVRPKTATYVDANGNEIQVPVGEDGTPLIPVPPGYTLKTDTPATADPTPDPAQQQQQQVTTQQEEDPSDGREFGGGPAGLTMNQSKISVLKQLDDALGVNKTGFSQTIADIDNKYKAPQGLASLSILGGIGREFKRGSETRAALKDYDYDNLAAQSGLTREELDGVIQELTSEVYSGYRDPVTGEVSGQKDPRSAFERGKDFLAGIGGKKEEDFGDEFGNIADDGTMPTTTGVETARVTEKAAGKTVRQTAEEFRADEARRAGLAGISPEQLKDTGLADELIAQTANALMARGVSSVDALRAAETAVNTGTIDPDVAASFGGAEAALTDASLAGRSLTRADDAVPSGVAASIARSQRARAVDTKKDTPVYREPDPSSDILPGEPGSDIAPTLDREEVDRQTQNYRNKGYNASDAKKSARNKVAADNRAKQQARDRGESEEHIAKTTAVTDSSGNPVTHTSKVTGKTTVVTNEPEKDDPGPSKIVCTEMYRQTQLDDWKEAIKIWGVYEKKYLTPYHEKGYHWLFMPWVKGMRRSTIMTSVGAYLAAARTQHLKHVMTRGKAPDSIVGNLWCKIVHPLVYVAGRTKEWLKL